jgi:CHAT domain-containing protein
VVANPVYDLRLAKTTNQTAVARRSADFAAFEYAPLPGTAIEAQALQRLIPNAQVLTQGQATEAALKKLVAPRILHIATHGFFLNDLPQNNEAARSIGLAPANAAPAARAVENPLLRSGLVLAGVRQQQSGAGEDGVLTALETAGLNLWGTRLVVLSACETGLGEARNGSGVYGLRRALVLAGSETQVMSLWQVSDTATRDLMIAYYQLLQAGAGRVEALRQVQLAMLRGNNTTLAGAQTKLNTQHPYFWAAFIASGDWKTLEAQEPKKP